MTRTEKKCLVFSVGMHATLLGTLIASAALRHETASKDIPIINFIPSTITEGTAANVPGSPGASATAQMQTPAQPIQPIAPVPRPAPQPVAKPPTPKPVVQESVPEPRPIPRPRRPEPKPEPEAKPLADEGLTPRPRHPRQTHEIHPTFDKATPTTQKSRTRPIPTQSTESEEATEAAEAAATAAEQRRIRAQINRALGRLANNVDRSGAQGTVVDMPGQGSGAAFAGYDTVIYNVYYHAWAAPDSVANKLAAVNVKIVVSRSGNIISSEIISRSGDSALDRSVERVLRAVSHLPPFPPGARDEQRSFVIQFDLDAKEGNG